MLQIFLPFLRIFLQNLYSMDMHVNHISQIHHKHMETLNQFAVKSLAVFGSVARGETTESSDIDLLVEFNQPIGLFEFIRLKNYLEDLTGSKVDLVTSDAFRPSMRDTILSEAIYVA